MRFQICALRFIVVVNSYTLTVAAQASFSGCAQASHCWNHGNFMLCTRHTSQASISGCAQAPHSPATNYATNSEHSMKRHPFTEPSLFLSRGQAGHQSMTKSAIGNCMYVRTFGKRSFLGQLSTKRPNSSRQDDTPRPANIGSTVRCSHASKRPYIGAALCKWAAERPRVSNIILLILVNECGHAWRGLNRGSGSNR